MLTIVGMPVVTVVLVLPVTYGKLWPTRMRAAWLSAVEIWGQLRISSRSWVRRARMSRLKASLAAVNTKPPMPEVGDTRPTPRLPSPCKPTTSGDARFELPSVAELNGKPGVPTAVVLMLTPPEPRLRRNSTGDCTASSTPNSSVPLRSSSAIMHWIISCAGWRSMAWITRATSSNCSGATLMMSLLVTGSAMAITVRRISLWGVSATPPTL